MGYAFISYSTKNQSSADAMRTLFNKHNIDTWMAPYDIPAGSKYAAVITKAIRDCSCFVLLLSNDSQASEAVDSEVELATLTYKKSIITVELEKVMLNDAFTFYIHNKQIIAVHKIDEDSYEVRQVLDAVKAYTEEEKEKNIIFEDTEKDCEKSTSIDNREVTFIETHTGRMILGNRYELGNIIGQGGFGTVYKAKDLKSQDNVAVKIGGCSAKNTIELHRFLIGKTNENLCEVYDATITPKGESYIAMEWFDEGRPLSSLKDYREFTEKLGDDYPVGGHVFVLINVLKGLKCLHANGIVHADINPSNILTNGFVTKLIDYSSAFFAEDGSNLDGEHTYIIGGFNSPEEKKDFRSDLYSVGMVAFKWLTGELPDVDENGNLILDNVNIDHEAMLVLKKATAINSDDRYQTADEFIDALKKYLSYFLNSQNVDSLELDNEHYVEKITEETAAFEKTPDESVIKIKTATKNISTEISSIAMTESQETVENQEVFDNATDKMDDNTPKEKCRGHLVSSYRRALDVSKDDCKQPVEILMPDGNTKLFDLCGEFAVSNQKRYIVVRQKNDAGEYLFFVFRNRNGKITLISEGQDQKKVYRWFRKEHVDEYIFTDNKDVLKNNKKKHFAQDTAPKYYSSVDDIPQILILPEKYAHISSNAFIKLNPENKEIRQIIIADTVEEIEDNAFSGLVVTEAIYVPNSVKKIGYDAFTIKNGAYIYCEENSWAYNFFSHRDDVIVIKDVPFRRTVGKKTDEILEELSRSKNVTRIKSDTFPYDVDKREINEIIVPEGIRVLEKSALYPLKIKNRIFIPSSVTRIGAYAFDLMEGAYVECDKDSYAYFYCRKNGIINSVDLKRKGVCAYCGGRFIGLFKKKCSKCGREKNY